MKSIPIILSVALPAAWASDPPVVTDAAPLEFFESRIRPLLAEHCYSCHGDAEQKAGLRLDHIDTILSGGDSGPALVPGRPDESRLLRAVRYDDVKLQMPPRARLDAAAVADLTKWIELGAPWPNEARAEQKVVAPFDLAARKAEHWCWQPLRRTEPPADPTGAPRDAVDAFIDAALRERGLVAAGPADRATLLRRVSFDLIGLPPTAEEIDAFVADPAPDAYERRVDALLASPRFGERWARHWMDLTRYSETYGHEFDYPIEEAWRYRDYLIRALDLDVPYDQLVREHLAGDLLDPPRRNPVDGTNESIQATGHFFFHQATHGPVDVRQDEADRIDNQIDVLTKSFLGLTVSCARCHDHKFDAISTRDYYALAGYLKSSRRQIALLDPENRIEQAAARLAELATRAATRRAELLGSNAIESQRQAERYAAAVAALPPIDVAVRFEADGLAVVEVTRGEVRPQGMGEFGASRWSGDRQLWWTGAMPGDRLALEVVVPAAGRYRVAATFTKARDYAVARFALDGVELGPDRDFFSADVVPTGRVDLGERELVAGRHRFEVSIVGKNDAAVPGYMVGIDEVMFEPAAAPRDRATVIAEVATREGLDRARLERFAATPPSRRRDTTDRPAQSGRTFDDFESGFAEWKESGFAFGGAPARPGDVLTTQPDGVLTSNAAHSGKLGGRLRGALRSKSFTIDSDWVLYRLAGNGSRVRLIVDSYQLDVFNALLFEDLTFSVASPDGFEWRAHRVKKYRGHRAHIELLDEGDGWLAVDEIVFADSPDRAPTVGPAEPATTDERTRAEAALVADGRYLLTDPETVSIAAERAALDSQLPTPVAVLALEDGFGEDEYVFVRGKHGNRGADQPRRFLEALAGAEQGSAPTHGSGRRELADRWLAESNPLPARVAVNRIWHHLFGRGLVPTTDDFGKLGESPSNLDLLDHLAGWFRGAAGWSQKALIRRLVTSEVYRRSSDALDPATEAADPQNLLLHRAPLRRLEGEAIRDAMLAVSGSLDTTMYGRSVPIHLTPFMDGRGRPGSSGPLDGAGRRSVYVEVRRNFLAPFMLAFDTPLPSSTVGRRSVSNVPAQGLILMNDPFVLEMAKRTAQRLGVDATAPRATLVDAACRSILGRRAGADELPALVEFCDRQIESYGASDPAGAFERARADLCHVLFNAKEFYFLR